MLKKFSTLKRNLQRTVPRFFCQKVNIREMPLFKKKEQNNGKGRANVEEEQILAEEREYTQLRYTYGLSNFRFASTSEQILLIHPKIRGATPKNTTVSLQVEEAQALCQTIPGFHLTSSIVIPTDDSTRKRNIWQSGRLEAIMEWKQDRHITAIFINVDIMSAVQQLELSTYFGVPVYDRYNIVLAIFKLYARTKEAKLQIALAEIPYIRARLNFMDEYKGKDGIEKTDLFRTSGAIALSAVSGETSAQRHEILRLREHTLRKRIRAAVEHKAEEAAELRQKLGGAAKTLIIGVIGYTNAGKTTLIKTLTDAKKLCGEDRLFATLDTSLHHAVLPSRQKVLLADTIGFISNLPTKLFASFSATLQHIGSADLLLHVLDLSHPNMEAQREHVMETLMDLGVRRELLDTLITVGNKIDRCEQSRIDGLRKRGVLPPDGENDNGTANSNMFAVPISCRTVQGVKQLIKRIDKTVCKQTGAKMRRMQLSIASPTISYLYTERLVSEEPTPSDCGNYLVFDVHMTDGQLAKFQTATGGKMKRKSSNGEGT